MIIFIYGTTAEAIKLAPIARRLDERGVGYQQWVTFQHTDALVEILPSLGLRTPDHVIANGRHGQPLKKIPDVLFWLLAAWRWTVKNARPLRKTLPADSVVLVHGDTLTSVVGAYIARALRVPSAHVEAGLRSGNWRHPFPEELDRRMVGAMADIHYTPSEAASENLRGKKNVVFTHGNTVIDAVLDGVSKQSADGEQYGVVLLHRFEFISNSALVAETMTTLVEHSPHRLKFIVDAYAQSAVKEALAAFDDSRFEIVGKLRHENFIDLLRSAQFVVTDSGGIQEETALLGIPTLIHRVATERDEGLGKNIILSAWKAETVAGFLSNYENYRRPVAYPVKSPSDVIVDDLTERGLAVPQP